MLEALTEILVIFWDILLSLYGSTMLLIRARAQPRTPPGNMGWPMVGETLEFLAPHPIGKPEPFFAERVKKYGDLFKTSIYGMPAIVTTNVDVARFIMQNEGKLFRAWYPINFKYTIGEWTCMFHYGEFWRKQRHIVVNFLHKRLKSTIVDHIERHVTNIIKNWKVGDLITISKEAKESSMNLRMKQLFNYKLNEEELKQMMIDVSELVEGSLTVVMPIPGTAYYKSLQARKRVVKKLMWILKQRAESNEELEEEEKDFLATLVDNGYKPEPIMDITLGLIFGGFFTSATTTMVAVKFIKENPHVLKKLREEHMAIRNNKKEGEPLGWSDFNAMKYTNHVIMETLRVGNQVPVLYRTALQDIEVGDYIIPKGWNICASLVAVHTDAKNFENPFKFDPDRWETTTTKNFLAFGKGPRICPGSELAKMEASIFLHHMITRFDWTDVEPMDVILDGSAKIGNGMIVRLEPVTI